MICYNMSNTTEYQDEEVRKYLQELYWKQEKSLRVIAKELDIPKQTLTVMFEKLGIRVRTHKKSARLWWKQRKKKELAQPQ